MKIVSMLINVALIVFIVAMGIAFVYQIKRNNNNKKLVECVQAFDEEEKFFNKVNQYITHEKNEEFKTKGEVLKLWGLVTYDRKDEIIPLLDSIDFKPLYVRNGKFNKTKSNLNEDSFYYLCLACCNTLYGRNDTELLLKFKEKMQELEVELPNLLVLKLSLNAFKLYLSEDDLGEQLFSQTIQGETSGYHYARQLVGIYKDISAAYLAKIYLDQNRLEEYEIIKDNMQHFYKTKLGGRYLSELKVAKEYLVETIGIDD